ncbi:MAG: 4Fe-4S dicluster domain-containing protein [Euryarchaeota archaeon]|nr:4Fe-4S dicluster domain-containing protein [Euryarchaeota archaeon]
MDERISTDASNGNEGEPTDPQRRRFIKGVGIAAATGVISLTAGQLLAEGAARASQGLDGKEDARLQYAMVIDLAKCDGCKKCTKACQKEHFLAEDQEWIKVYKVDDGISGEYNLPRPCMMCANPPCRNVCPTGATFVNSDGLTLINHDKCIGCRFCLAACPYSARTFTWKEPEHTPEELAHTYSPEMPLPHRRGVAEKCMFCVHRRKEGKLPACVEGCPMGAIYFGDAAENAVTNSKGQTLPLRETLADNAAYRLRDHLGTGPSVFYLPQRGRRA